MRLFQNGGVYPAYRTRLRRLTRDCVTSAEWTAAFLNDRYGGSHILLPVLERDSAAFFTNGDIPECQRLWAKEHGMAPSASLDDILLAQIEEHRTEVFYNTDPMRFGNSFLRRLPGHVRRTIAWRAAPSDGGEFLEHDVIVNNFPAILDRYRMEGAVAEYLAPAHDPMMDAYAENTERKIDVVFIGGYSRHHRKRAVMLEAISRLSRELNVAFHLDVSRWTQLAESPAGLIGPLRQYRRPASVRAVAKPTVFGRELFSVLANARIVINGAIDMAGRDRGNMRVWEALGCKAALVTDDGNYPVGMVAGEHFLTYRDADEAVSKIRYLHQNETARIASASSGHEMLKNCFSKEKQWSRFCEIA